MSDPWEKAKALVDAMDPAIRQQMAEEIVAQSGKVWEFAVSVFGSESKAAASCLAIGVQASVQLGIEAERIHAAVQHHIDGTTELLAREAAGASPT